MDITTVLLVLTILVSLVGAALVLLNVNTLSKGASPITRSFRDLITGFVMLEVSAILVSAILLALVQGWGVQYLETAFDIVAAFAIGLRSAVIFYAWRVYRFLKKPEL